MKGLGNVRPDGPAGPQRGWGFTHDATLHCQRVESAQGRHGEWRKLWVTRLSVRNGGLRSPISTNEAPMKNLDDLPDYGGAGIPELEGAAGLEPAILGLEG
jgi:hypothetical protein